MLLASMSKNSRQFLFATVLRGALLTAPVLCVTFCPKSALAQDKKELSKARALFQRAIELEQAGNYPTALEQFREVGQVRMTPQVRFHIASCEEKLGKLVTALGGYELALADADSVGDDFKGEVDTAVTRLRASIPKLVIQRGAGAEAAEMELDGVALGASSIGVSVPLDPGPHSITAKSPGYEPFSQTVTIAENEQKTLEVVLTAEPQDAAGSGSGGTRTVIVTEKPRGRYVPYIIGGVGAASLVASGVLFALRQSALSDLESKCGPDRKSCPRSSQSEVDHLGVYNTSAQVALGIGVVGVGTAVTLILLQKKPAPAETTTGLSFVPSAPNSVAGASFAGRF